MHKELFNLRFSPKQILYWASRYSYRKSEAEITELSKKVGQQDYLTHQQLLQFFDWKTGGRGRSRCLKNPPSYVKELTRFAFAAKEERLRIEVLTLLDGVRWPVASAILHFVFPDKYPLLDFRALWSLGIDPPPPYNYPFWKAYTDFCRAMAKANNVDLRTLDRALWQYSKENQRDKP